MKLTMKNLMTFVVTASLFAPFGAFAKSDLEKQLDKSLDKIHDRIDDVQDEVKDSYKNIEKLAKKTSLDDLMKPEEFAKDYSKDLEKEFKSIDEAVNELMDAVGAMDWSGDLSSDDEKKGVDCKRVKSWAKDVKKSTEKGRFEVSNDYIDYVDQLNATLTSFNVHIDDALEQTEKTRARLDEARTVVSELRVGLVDYLNGLGDQLSCDKEDLDFGDSQD